MMIPLMVVTLMFIRLSYFDLLRSLMVVWLFTSGRSPRHALFALLVR